MLVHIAVKGREAEQLAERIRSCVQSAIAALGPTLPPSRLHLSASSPTLRESVDPAGERCGVSVLIYANDGIEARKKQRLLGGIAGSLASALQLRPEEISVGIVEMPRGNWLSGHSAPGFEPVLSPPLP